MVAQIAATGGLASASPAREAVGARQQDKSLFDLSPTGGAATDGGSPLLPNPKLSFDPAAAMVVVVFRDGNGEVRETLPTERELKAYRMAGGKAAASPDKPAGAGSSDSSVAVAGASPGSPAKSVPPANGTKVDESIPQGSIAVIA